MITQTSHPQTIQHLIFAVVGAAVIVFVGRFAVDRLVGGAASAQPQIAQHSVQQSDALADEDRTTAEARRDRLEHEQTLVDEAEARRREKEQAIEAAQTQIAETARANEDRKEQAWQHFYKKPKKCDNPPDNATLVECSNNYLHEQQRFEALYAAGKL
ncbi:MAG TPA: hypothetical protein VFW00_11970 [Rhodocyclaceae bacterium]|nr:hypothetical protein [Rhodocyclaceae bacterium]